MPVAADKVNGDEAEAKSHLQILSVVQSDKTEQISSDIVLHFKKEPARRFLIYPMLEWKVTKIDGIGKIEDIGI